jgi:hypothetical protein
LRGKIVDPTVFQPGNRVRVKVMVLIEFNGHVGRKAFPVNSKRTHAEQRVGSRFFDSLVQCFDQLVNILAAPIPQIRVAAISCVKGVIWKRAVRISAAERLGLDCLHKKALANSFGL